MILDIPSLILFVGSSKSGKTHAIKSLILDYSLNKKYKNRFNFGLVFTTTKFNCTSFLPEYSVFKGFDMKIIVDFCDELEKKYGKQIKKNEKEGRDATYGVPASFIVFDDIMSLINQKSGEFKNFISI
jgi:hypothetical protein